MIYCERHDDGCWASKPRHNAIPSLMKVSSHFLQKKVLNIFSKTSSGVIPPPTISARRKRYSRIDWFSDYGKDERQVQLAYA